MSHQALAKRIRDAAKLKGEFTLRSGEESDTYFDKYLFESDPQILSEIANEMRHLVPVDTDILCGMELGGIPIVTMLSHLTGIPAAFIRKEAKTHGTCKYAEGPDLNGKNLLVVEDVVSSGGAIINSVNMMRADGLVVDKALCVIDRRNGRDSPLQEAGISLTALLTMDEIENA